MNFSPWQLALSAVERPGNSGRFTLIAQELPGSAGIQAGALARPGPEALGGRPPERDPDHPFATQHCEFHRITDFATKLLVQRLGREISSGSAVDQ